MSYLLFCFFLSLSFSKSSELEFCEFAPKFHFGALLFKTSLVARAENTSFVLSTRLARRVKTRYKRNTTTQQPIPTINIINHGQRSSTKTTPNGSQRLLHRPSPNGRRLILRQNIPRTPLRPKRILHQIRNHHWRGLQGQNGQNRRGANASSAVGYGRSGTVPISHE